MTILDVPRLVCEPSQVHQSICSILSIAQEEPAATIGFPIGVTLPIGAISGIILMWTLIYFLTYSIARMSEVVQNSTLWRRSRPKAVWRVRHMTRRSPPRSYMKKYSGRIVEQKLHLVFWVSYIYPMLIFTILSFFEPFLRVYLARPPTSIPETQTMLVLAGIAFLISLVYMGLMREIAYARHLMLFTLSFLTSVLAFMLGAYMVQTFWGVQIVGGTL